VATGRPQRLYRVARVKGDWLWLESGDVRGWVEKDEVIPFQQAMEECDRAIGTGREPEWAYFRRGNLWLGKKEWARAVDDYSAALRQAPTDPVILRNRGLAWSQLKDHNRAVADYSAAIQFDPQYGWAYESRGRAWAEVGAYENAVADFSEALRLDPDDLVALQGRGLAWVQNQRFDAAIADLTEALRRNPKLPRAHVGLGFAWKSKQEYERALTEFHAAIRLDPNLADAFNGVAMIRATCPDPRYRNASVAFAAASKAFKLHGGTCAHCLDTLAAAYAEAGDFNAAVKWESKALATRPIEETDQQSFRTRLSLYQAKKPYRDLRGQPAASIAVAPPSRDDESH
jgi:tetratricopeptide (TPR) repeat protein